MKSVHNENITFQISSMPSHGNGAVPKSRPPTELFFIKFSSKKDSLASATDRAPILPWPLSLGYLVSTSIGVMNVVVSPVVAIEVYGTDRVLGEVEVEGTGRVVDEVDVEDTERVVGEIEVKGTKR